MLMDSRSFKIFCPEHNEHVQSVCLINGCYQKLLCSYCNKKHRNVHRNDSVPLVELINDLKKFQFSKLQEGEDLSGYQEQIRSGHKILRDSEGRTSEWINLQTMKSIDGKDQMSKQEFFAEKAQKRRNRLSQKEVQGITNNTQICLTALKKKLLMFEKRMSESVERELCKSTSKNVLELKYVKDAAVQEILDSLKSNTERYNMLSRSLIKLHKGYLELNISKKIFRDMTRDINSRLKVLSKNVGDFFDSEVDRLFSFIFDDIDFEKYNNINSNNNNHESNKIKSKDKAQMDKMIDELKRIKTETEYEIRQQDQIDQMLQIKTLPDEFTLQQPSQNNIQLGPFSSTVINFPEQTDHVNQMSLISMPYDSSDTKLTRSKRAEIARSLDYQKKEIIIDLEKLESQKFTEVKKKLNEILSQQQSIISSNKCLISNFTPVKQGNLSLDMSADQKSKKVNLSNQSQNLIQSQSMLQFISPAKKSVNFRIHQSNTLNTSFIQQNQPQPQQSKLQSQSTLMQNQTPQAQDSILNRKDSKALISLPRKSISGQQTPLLQEDNKTNESVSRSSLLAALTNPTLRSFGQINLRQPSKILLKQPLPEQAKLLKQQEGSQSESFQDQQSQSQQSNEQYSCSSQSSLIDYQYNQQEKTIVIGMESVSQNKFLLIQQNGQLQVWQASCNNISSSDGYPSIQKVKELNLCKRVNCYCLIQSNNNSNSSNQSDNSSGISDPIMMAISGQNENSNESLVFIVKYESKRNRFLKIDAIKYDQECISCLASGVDKSFKRKNLPSSLQIVTDVIYLFTLNPFQSTQTDENTVITPKLKEKNNLQQSTTAPALFQINENEQNNENNDPVNITSISDKEKSVCPMIEVSRIQFHRDKHGSGEKVKLSSARLSTPVIMHKLIYDTYNDCLWGNSDYQLFKWSINFNSGTLESHHHLILCSNQNDMLTSMHQNNNIIVLSSLHGQLWGIDVMLNKVFNKDCQMCKYSSINNYHSKIQGKDPIIITSGSVIYAPTANNSLQQYFAYSSVSAQRPKLFIFSPDFKEVIAIIPGQVDHISHVICTDSVDNSQLVAIEELNKIRLYPTNILQNKSNLSLEQQQN